MSRTPDHYDCPSGTVRSWGSRPSPGRQEVAYVPETEVIDNPVRAYRYTEAKRRWKRVGLLCMDCLAFPPDHQVGRPPADGLPTARGDGIPETAIATDGIPTGSGG